MTPTPPRSRPPGDALALAHTRTGTHLDWRPAADGPLLLVGTTGSGWATIAHQIWRHAGRRGWLTVTASGITPDGAPCAAQELDAAARELSRTHQALRLRLDDLDDPTQPPAHPMIVIVSGLAELCALQAQCLAMVYDIARDGPHVGITLVLHTPTPEHLARIEPLLDQLRSVIALDPVSELGASLLWGTPRYSAHHGGHLLMSTPRYGPTAALPTQMPAAAGI